MSAPRKKPNARLEGGLSAERAAAKLGLQIACTFPNNALTIQRLHGKASAAVRRAPAAASEPPSAHLSHFARRPPHCQSAAQKRRRLSTSSTDAPTPAQRSSLATYLRLSVPAAALQSTKSSSELRSLHGARCNFQVATVANFYLTLPASVSSNRPVFTLLKLGASKFINYFVTMKIHPSVILNISEHHTRAQANKSTDPVFGALLGKADTIVDSFEIIEDASFYQAKLDFVRQVAQDLEVLGWYSTTDRQPQIDGLGKVFLKLDPNRRDGYLPVNVYTTFGSELVEVDWEIVTDDVEIIGLEHAKGADARLHPQLIALKRLRQRIKLISKFVKDVQAGVLTGNKDVYEIIRSISTLTHRPNSKQYSRALNVQCNDVALQTYLGIMIKGCDMLNRSKLKLRSKP